jgi:hypothetical protein
MLLSGNRIVSVRRHDAFLDAVREGMLGIPPRIQRVRAIYLISELDGTLRAACFFTLGFDPRGRIPREFSLPVRDLALHSGDGPDLGTGAIRIAHQGQCSIPWHVERLWGRSAEELRPWLAAAQQLLGSRLRGPGHGASSDGGKREDGSSRDQTVVDFAERRAERAFGPDHTLTRQQLEKGRRLANRRTATDGDEVVGGERTWTVEQVEALRARHRNEISVLKQEIDLLRRRLRAAESQDD